MITIARLLAIGSIALIGSALAGRQAPATARTATPGDGRPIRMMTFTNPDGTEMRVTNYGGIITSLKTLDRAGHLADVTLGFDKPDEYQSANPFFGALIGRYGNRIAKGTFTLDG